MFCHRRFRKAKRLVLDEMNSLNAQLRLLQTVGRSPENQESVLDTPEWERNKDVLAELVPADAHWEVICTFFQTTAILRRTVLWETAGAPLPPGTLALVATSVSQANEASLVLDAAKMPELA